MQKFQMGRPLTINILLLKYLMEIVFFLLRLLNLKRASILFAFGLIAQITLFITQNFRQTKCAFFVMVTWQKEEPKEHFKHSVNLINTQDLYHQVAFIMKSDSINLQHFISLKLVSYNLIILSRIIHECQYVILKFVLQMIK